MRRPPLPRRASPVTVAGRPPGIVRTTAVATAVGVLVVLLVVMPLLLWGAWRGLAAAGSATVGGGWVEPANVYGAEVERVSPRLRDLGR